MKAKWTPGPWYYRPEEPLVEAQNNEGFNMTVADCSRSYVLDDAEAKANAQLIALLPEMAEAIIECDESGVFDSEPPKTRRATEAKAKARALLARLEVSE